jgi:hypothetical protein
MKRCFAALLGFTSLVWLAPAQDEPKLLEPVNLPFNTDKDEDDPHVSSNNLTFFYVTNANKKLEIMSSTRKTAKDPWPAGQLLASIKSKDADFRSPFLTADGKFPQRFYYSSNQDPLTKGAKGDNYDVYFLVKIDAKAEFGSYNAVVTIGTEMDEMHPWLTPDEKQIYFSRKTEGGWRQFVASKPPDGGQFGKPIQLKLPLGLHHATLTPDGKTMYLQGPVESQGKGRRWGLFVSTSMGKETWSKPEPLVSLNHPMAVRGDMSPSLSRDGTVLYFASDRPGGKGGLDIWMIPTAQLKTK